jgi:hypothetical protein
MTQHKQTIDAFTALGQLFNDYTTKHHRTDNWIAKLDDRLAEASMHNKWFSMEQLDFCLEAWAKTLSEDAITAWLANYAIRPQSKRLGLVLAGNVPLVGLHDLLCGLACGYSIEAKLSSNDAILLPMVMEFLSEQNPIWKNKVVFTDGKLSSFDAVIATGSSNTARYFHHYFKDVPHVVRQTRNGVAVLTGSETTQDLAALCVDITQYFGLGCRSVSHLMVPKDYDFNDLFLALYAHKDIIYHNAYANNYDYNKAVYLMQERDLLDNGFMLVKKDSGFHSPIACVHYSEYEHLDQVTDVLKKQADRIQCVVGSAVKNGLSFGQTQYPKLTDYADHVDTMAFLLKN